MNSGDIEDLGWELIGWEGDDHPAHVTNLTRDEILQVNKLFPERGEDELLATAVYPVSPETQSAMRAAVPHLSFRPGLDYMLGGFRRE
ncbi:MULTISPECIES: hypothetical protein [unclassified Streptomyces]|uniref:hypothetical protein n=1 Tax=unclassified Streptomyces TaxID=2593676 RepID=UPI0036FF93D4